MRIRRLDETGATWTATIGPVAAACLLAAVGCAHHKADQYAYAPPYAPAVYPQPQVQMPVQMPAQPAAYAAAPGGVPAGAVPMVGMPAGAIPAGTVVSAVGGECPPCAEGVVMPATVIDGSGQTPPCPPGP